MDLKTLARAYDRSAASYDERFRALQRPKYEAAARLLGGLVAGTRCLDAGGGTGLFAEFAPALRVTVLDASLAMLRVAARRGEASRAGQSERAGATIQGGEALPAGAAVRAAGTGSRADLADGSSGRGGDPGADWATRAGGPAVDNASAGRAHDGGSVCCVLGDLVAPPFPPRSFPLVVSFTAVLAEVPRALRALGALVAPGGQLVVSFLAAEAPPVAQIAGHTGLRAVAGPVRAGQDEMTVLVSRR